MTINPLRSLNNYIFEPTTGACRNLATLFWGVETSSGASSSPSLVGRVSVTIASIVQSAWKKLTHLFWSTWLSEPSTSEQLHQYLDLYAPADNPEKSEKPILRTLQLCYFSNLRQEDIDAITPYFPNLHKLSIFNDDKISDINLPQATEISINCCTSLQRVWAPRATDFRLDCCTSLQKLEALKATNVDVYGCTRLQTLKAPKATFVWATYCRSLRTLMAPKATTAWASRCTSLRTLRAPEATDVIVNGCTNLRTLMAPKATKVRANGCTSLQTFVTAYENRYTLPQRS